MDCSKYTLSKLDKQMYELSYKINIEKIKKKKQVIELILENKINHRNKEETLQTLKQYNIPEDVYFNLTLFECTMNYLNKLTEKINKIELNI